MKIGIQGIEGSFHDLAASTYFLNENYVLEPFMAFRSLAVALNNQSLDYGVMAIENTIAGSLLPNYALINEYDLKIVGEVYSRIELSFLVNKGVKIEDVEQVKSHPIALLQCADFFGKYPHIKIVESEDTAESAKAIKENQQYHVAAIASKRAGELFDLDILAENIETNKLNYTRFLVISGAMNGAENSSKLPHRKWVGNSKEFIPDPMIGELNQMGYRPAIKEKASLRLITSHEPGSLTDILQIFKQHKLNLTKIQSVPIIGKPYQYAFNIDLVWDDYEDYLKGIEVARPLAEEIKIFGEYKKGNFPTIK